MTYYDLLGVPRYATFDQIKSAYRQQIRFFHPDTFDGSPDIANIKSRQLNEAYRILSTPSSRFQYDESLYEKDSRYISDLKRQCLQYKAEAEAARQRAARDESERQHSAKDADTNAQQSAQSRGPTINSSRFSSRLRAVVAFLLVVALLAVGISIQFFSTSSPSPSSSSTPDLPVSSQPIQTPSSVQAPSAQTVQSTPEFSKEQVSHNSKGGLMGHAGSPLNPDMPQPRPDNAKVFYKGFSPSLATSLIIINSPKDKDCVVKMKNESDETVLSFYVRKNSTVEKKCPPGNYTVYFAYGSTWYGYSKLFGSSMTGQKDSNVTFDADYSWEYTLYAVSDGNLTLDTASSDDLLSD